jgi:alanine-alpha-ketoisovalerate/valine-pyruvate aminotransferase
VVAPPYIARAVAALTAVSGLANGNLGQAIVHPLLEDGSILRLVTQSHYGKKLNFARQVIADCFPQDASYFLHETEVAMCLWLRLQKSKKPHVNFSENSNRKES